ncbi:MAG TPA: UDP-N-acetylmuramoyl-tripeptide--D-alanyl-D-alanine ligase [Elusimicrobiales bacterium]|nr:UDP-N-acetylmuramoyl-tripeptide--D-alanyl-D-alanine ligase [Elusimicrobiales bacterium]
MKLNLTWKKLETITEGKLTAKNPNAKFNSFITHSKLVTKNSVFWCLKGDSYDAHRFLPEVIRKGAKGIVVKKGTLKKLKKAPLYVLEVADTLKALHALSLFRIKKSKMKIVAVTGSNGKTTTKEMLKLIFRERGKTFANAGNLNNQFGVPFSIMEIDTGSKYGIFELAAKKRGDIYEIGNLVKPDVAVITNISPSHLEYFKNIGNIYRTKTEITKCIKKGGTLVYNADDTMLGKFKKSWKGKSITFGFSEDADIRVLREKDFVISYRGGEYKIPSKLQTHNRINAAGACGVAIAMGLDWKTITKGLKGFKSIPMRLEVIHKGKSTIIFDAYNANPKSTDIAIQTLSDMKTTKSKIAVLGDMKELGKFSKKYHLELGGKLITADIDTIFMTGGQMYNAYKTCCKKMPKNKLIYSKTPSVWIKRLKDARKKGAVILFKASRSMGFENLLKKL